MPTTNFLVGREAELHELRVLLGRSGKPLAVFLVGEASVGKTALLEATVEVAAGADARVLWARPTMAKAGHPRSAAPHHPPQPLAATLDTGPSSDKRHSRAWLDRRFVLVRGGRRWRR